MLLSAIVAEPLSLVSFAELFALITPHRRSLRRLYVRRQSVAALQRLSRQTSG